MYPMRDYVTCVEACVSGKAHQLILFLLGATEDPQLTGRNVAEIPLCFLNEGIRVNSLRVINFDSL